MAKKSKALNELRKVVRTQRKKLRALRKELRVLDSRLSEHEAAGKIRNTLLDYTLYHDRGLSDQLAELFTDDAVLDISGYGARLDTSLKGRAAIRAMFQQVDGRTGAPPPHKHAITNLRIKINGTKALASSYLLDWGGAATEEGPGGSMYHDRLQQQSDGRWLIKHKRIICTSQVTVDAVLSANI
jgi:ketosteroid isomerase-like protein